MAAMFVVAGGVRWRERRAIRRAGGGPSTAVVGSPQETYQERQKDPKGDFDRFR